MLENKEIETIIKGFANHRRIEILKLLSNKPNISVEEISEILKVNYKTISEHTRRMSNAGLVNKKYKGAAVLHSLTPLGKIILKFLRTLE